MTQDGVKKRSRMLKCLACLFVLALGATPTTYNGYDGFGGPSVVAEAATLQQKASASEIKRPALPLHKTIVYTVEGMQQKAVGTLFRSSLGYALYVLPNYQASAEEPGRDILLFRLNEQNTTRIERLAQKVNLSAIKRNAKDELKLLGTVRDVTSKLPGVRYVPKFVLVVVGKRFTKEIFVLPIGNALFKFTLTSSNETEGHAREYAMVNTMVLTAD